LLLCTPFSKGARSFYKQYAKLIGRSNSWQFWCMLAYYMLTAITATAADLQHCCCTASCCVAHPEVFSNIVHSDLK
jgi:hypothetical protein